MNRAKKLFGGLFSICLIASGTAFAESPTKSTVKWEQKSENRSLNRSLELWLAKMKKRIARTQAKHNQLIAVASVRGSESKDPVPLYWKGSAKNAIISAPELKMFDQAVQLAGHDPDAARAQMEAFVIAYPKSPLLDDAKKTLSLLAEDVASAQ